MEGKPVQMICPNCQNKFYVQVTGQSQKLVCPFCNFHGQVRIQAPQQPQYYQQYQQPAQLAPARSLPSPKRTKTYLTILIAVVLIIILISAGTVYLLLSMPSSEDEEEGGELEIIRVWHEPENPDTDDVVHFLAEIVNCPSSYTVLFNISVFEEDTMNMAMRGWLLKKPGSQNIYERVEDFTDTSYDSGREVRFFVEIFDENWYPGSEDLPIMTSEIDTFIIS